jgi:hypothetical protein
MSSPSQSTPRSPRRPNDAYMTPRWQTEALLQHQSLGDSPIIFEPCAGDLSIVRALPTLPPLAPQCVITNDIDPAMACATHNDASRPECWEELQDRSGGCDWVVTNPPFAQAFHLPILRYAFTSARIGVAMICRLSFLEPTKDRGPWLSDFPPDRMIVLPRHSYTGNGSTDSVTTAWMIWFTDPMWVKWATTVPPIVIAHGSRPVVGK